MRIYLLSLLSFFLVFPQFSFSQSQKEHTKGVYVDSLNRYYQHVELPVYIYVSTSPKQAPIQLKEANKDTLQPIYLDGIGVHNIRHVNSMQHRVENFPIYADGTAPRTNIVLKNAPSHVAKSEVFYGADLVLDFQVTDDMSGVESTYCSLNGGEYVSFQHEMPITKEGVYTYKYYSVDNVGNVEDFKEKTFTVDSTPPKTYYDILGITSSNVISLTSKITLTAIDSLSGVAAIYYSIDDTPVKRYGSGAIPIAQLANGEHTLTVYSIDNVRNQEEPQQVVFYLDRTAPIMSADILGDKFIVEDKVYFSGRTKVKLTAIDNKAGVKEVFFAINGGKFEQYTAPFYLPTKSGKYEISYYATDFVGNNTGESKITHSSGVVYVDLTGPQLRRSFVGSTFMKGEVAYINSKTLHKLTARDSESGLQRIAYIIDGGEEQEYTNPFAIEQPGLHKVVAIAYDNVNNRNEDSYSVFVDNDGPIIMHSFSSTSTSTDEGGVATFPSYAALFLSAVDEGTTVLSISYAIGDGKYIPYTTPISGFEKLKSYRISVKALDALGNESVRLIEFKTNDL